MDNIPTKIWNYFPERQNISSTGTKKRGTKYSVTEHLYSSSYSILHIIIIQLIKLKFIATKQLTNLVIQLERTSGITHNELPIFIDQTIRVSSIVQNNCISTYTQTQLCRLGRAVQKQSVVVQTSVDSLSSALHCKSYAYCIWS